MDFVKDGYYTEAKDKGLPTEEEKLDYLDKQGDWTLREESELKGLKSYIQQLQLNKSKLFLEKTTNLHISNIFFQANHL